MKVLIAYAISPGGLGTGMGVPLALRTVTPGGFGTGIGVPLALRTENPGGFGTGMGVPLRRATRAVAAELLDKSLTELLTGSTIKTAKPSNASWMQMFFFMVKDLLTATMKDIRKS